jgi:hypothetical protein
MGDLINELKHISNSRELTFSEHFYRSIDHKTIMGEIPFREILFLDYRDTEAGSNPREYIGLIKTNKVILQSILSHNEMFRFLHSGIILSLTDVDISDKKLAIKYGDCCLTNGNQTRFLILIITLLKLFSSDQNLSNIDNKKYSSFVKSTFGDSPKILTILHRITFSKIYQVVTFFKNNTKYFNDFNKINLSSFLDLRVRIQVNPINFILSDLEEKLDEYSIGSLIAEANNDTQNVKADDIFGNKYKRDLETYLFNTFITANKENINIEYRFGEVSDKVFKVHILALLRPIIATGILTKEKKIFEYTNQRDPIYKTFEKLLRNKDKANKTIEIISDLIPLLYDIRKTYVEPELDLQKKNFIREYVGKATADGLSETIVANQISYAKNEKEIEKILRPHINYNIEHIFPVLIYRIRKLFIKYGPLDKITFIVPEDKLPDFFRALIEAIYRKYIETKFSGLPSSLTTFARSKDFYKTGEETYIALKNAYHLEESDFLEKNKYHIE